MTLTAVVIGCGRIGSDYDRKRHSEPRSHAGAYQASSVVRLAAGVDPDPARRAAFTQRWGVPTFASVEALTAAMRPEIWSICTPPDVRLEIVRAALASGARAIWCEKPLAHSVHAATEIARLTEDAAVPLVLNYSRRWDARHRVVARWISQGRFGALEHASVHYTRGLRNYGTHAIDLLRWFFGGPSWVHAFTGYDSSAADPSPVALLGYATGGFAALLPARRRTYNLFEISLFGTHQQVTLGDFGRKIAVRNVLGDRAVNGERLLGRPHVPRELMVRSRGALRSALSDVVNAVRTDTTPACTARDGIIALSIAEAIEESARRGEAVMLDTGT